IVTTDHPDIKEIRLSVAGTRVGPIAVVPGTVRLHGLNPDDGGTAILMITVQNAPDTKIEVLEAPNNLKVEVRPSDVRTGTAAKVRQYRMTVTVPPDSPSGVIDGAIILKTDHPQVDRLKVPLDITVLGGN